MQDLHRDLFSFCTRACSQVPKNKGDHDLARNCRETTVRDFNSGFQFQLYGDPVLVAKRAVWV